MLRRDAARALLALAATALVCAPAAGADWSHWRGPTHDGRSAARGVFGDGFGLQRDWKVRLGSAYSGIVVADGRVVTMFSDGASDQLVALSAADGSEIWRYRIGETYRGHDGSDDGPLSTPVLDRGTVYALGPRGRLFAVRLADGREVWSLDMASRFGSFVPEYGFTTTPLVEGDVLVLQAGGSEGKSIVGLDPATGKTLWTRLDHHVEYQSPSVVTLAGRRQIVAADKEHVAGIDPASGRVLWTHEHRGTGFSSSPHVVPLGPDRFLLKFWMHVGAFAIRRSGEGFAVDKVYAAEVFQKSYLPPLYHEGHLYGFTSEFLTCVDAATGERVWRSRPPGGKGMVLVDGHLVILGARGVVTVARATPEGYREKARVQALEGSDFAWPSFADGRIFVRNLKELAAVSVTEGSGRTAERRPPAVPGSKLHGLIQRATAAADPRAVVEEFLAAQERLPIVENRRWVHFLYHGPAEDVAVSGSLLDDGAAHSLERIAATDLWYRTYELAPDARYEYRFQVDFEGHVTDPRNPHTEPDRYEGSWSVLTMPDHPAPERPAPIDAARRGRVVTLPHVSKVLRNRRLLRIYLPAGYAESGERYPVLYVSEGAEWIDKGRMPEVLDRQIGRGVAPVIVVFVEKPSRNAWYELGRKLSEEYAQMLAEEIVPAIDSRYRTLRQPGARVLMGATDAARVSLHAALLHPQVFGGVAVRTMSLAGTGEEVLAQLSRTRPALRLFVDWNRFEQRSGAQRYDRRQDSLRLVRVLTRVGLAPAGGERADSHGWGSLRDGLPAVLEHFFPAR